MFVYEGSSLNLSSRIKTTKAVCQNEETAVMERKVETYRCCLQTEQLKGYMMINHVACLYVTKYNHCLQCCLFLLSEKTAHCGLSTPDVKIKRMFSKNKA